MGGERGSGQKITILHGGGVYRDPQNAQSNLWTAPYQKEHNYPKVDIYEKDNSKKHRKNCQNGKTIVKIVQICLNYLYCLNCLNCQHCHQKLSSKIVDKIVIKNCHKKLSSKGQGRLSTRFHEKRCHRGCVILLGFDQ